MKISIKIFVMLSILISIINAGDSFKKVMAKNRASKGIGNSNYKVINGNKEFKRAQRNSREIGIDARGTRVGTVYNYVEIKNVKMKEKKYKREYGLAKFSKKPKKKKLYGVKIDKNFKGNINNTVKVKNSTLN